MAYLRDQGDKDGALEVQASLVQRFDVAESPDGDPPTALFLGPFPGSGSIGLLKRGAPRDDASNKSGDDSAAGEEEEEEEDKDERIDRELNLSIPFDGVWFDDEDFSTPYTPTTTRRLKGLRYHQWENMAEMKYYQLCAEASDVEAGSWYVTVLCCLHSWTPEVSPDEPTALIATTSMETPEFVQALPYRSIRRIPLASALSQNAWGHIVAGVVAVPLGAKAKVRATIHAEQKDWWRSGLVVHSMILTRISDGHVQPVLPTLTLKAEPDFKTSGLASPVAKSGGKTDGNDSPSTPSMSSTKMFDETMSPVLGAAGGILERANPQARLEMFELRRQLWRAQEETRATRSKLEVALGSMNDVTSERREREERTRQERATEVNALRGEIDRLQTEVEEFRDLERRYSSIEAQLRKSESEARRQGDRAFKALKEEQVLRTTLEDARRDANENRLQADAAIMKSNEMRSNYDDMKAQYNATKAIAEADKSRLDGIVKDQEILLKETDELLKDSKEEAEKQKKLAMANAARVLELEKGMMKTQQTIMQLQRTNKVLEGGMAAGGSLSSGGPTRSPDDASSRQMDGLLGFLNTMTTDRGFDSVLFEIAEKGAAIVGASHATVFKVDKHGRSLFSWGGDDDFTVPYRGGKGGLVGMAVTECKPVRAENVEADTRAVEHEKEFEGRNDDEPQPTFSILCSPITYFDEDGDESAAAVLEFYNKVGPSGKPVAFSLRDEIIAGSLASTLSTLVKVDDIVMDAIMEEDEEESDDDDEPEKERTPEQLKRDLTKANLKIAELERKIAELEKNGLVGTKMKVAKSGPPSRAARKKKGQAIIQRSVSIETGKLVEVKRYDKEDYVQDLILSTLKKNPIFCKFENCTPNELDQVVGAFEPHEVAKGVNLITQGESGDFFYIIESGTFKILINLPDGSQKQVAIFKPGQGVGELALIQDAPRAATVQAATNARVWRLKRENCDIVTFLRKKRNELCIRYMGSIRISKEAQASLLGGDASAASADLKDCTLKDLISESAIDGLVAQLTQEVFEPGVCIMQQGQRGDELFIIEEGTVDIMIANAEELKTGQLGKKVADIKAGTVFGEKALLGGDRRNASCVANNRIKAFRLAREDFEKALGSLAELLRTKAEGGDPTSPGSNMKISDIPLRDMMPLDIAKDLKMVSALVIFFRSCRTFSFFRPLMLPFRVYLYRLRSLDAGHLGKFRS